MAMVPDTAAARAYKLVNGFRASQLVRLAAQLRIPDLVADGPRSPEELGMATGIAAGRLLAPSVAWPGWGCWWRPRMANSPAPRSESFSESQSRDR